MMNHKRLRMGTPHRFRKCRSRSKLKYDWPILAEYRGPENIAHYKLNPSCNPAGLKYPRSARALKPKNGGQP